MIGEWVSGGFLVSLSGFVLFVVVLRSQWFVGWVGYRRLAWVSFWLFSFVVGVVSLCCGLRVLLL